MRVPIGPSPMPTKVLTVEVSLLSVPSLSNEERRLLPFSAVCADSVGLLARLPKMSVGCCATAFASCRGPLGLVATSARPLKIEGTTAATALCARALSRPEAVASFPTSSGDRNRETADTMLAFMEGPSATSKRSTLASQALQSDETGQIFHWEAYWRIRNFAEIH
jgi:hypothetical protein